MMTDRDLATLVREHVTHDEPPFLMSAETSIALGRRTLLRRRARRGLAGVLVAAAAVAAVPLLPWHNGPSRHSDGIDPATTAVLEHYDAQRMRAIIDEHVRVALGHGLERLGQAEFAARDNQGAKLPARYWDKASSMDVTYRGTGDRSVRVMLLHARSEAEGDARKVCTEDLASGYAFTCQVSTAPNGDVVTTRVTASRPSSALGPDGWGPVFVSELRTGQPLAGNPDQSPIEPSQVYFQRSVESVHSETFLTNASETVRAPSFEGAQQAFKVPVEDLEKVVTDPELVIPEPPTGPGGCPWTWKMKVTCTNDDSTSTK